MKPVSRNNQHRNQFDYQGLEARQLLAGDVMGPHQVAGTLPSMTNQVVNGDFESLDIGDDRLFTDDQIEGWSARDAANGQLLNLLPYNNDYGIVLDLDSTASVFDEVFQDVVTISNREYLITFDYRSHFTSNPNATNFSNDFEVLWNGQTVGRFVGGELWHTGTISVNSGLGDVEGASSELAFREIAEPGAGQGDGLGPLLDNIRVIATTSSGVGNSSFEATSSNRDLFFRPQDVPGWGAMAADANDRWLKIPTSEWGIPNATDGNQYLNLDATETTRDIVFQDLKTIPGVHYYVTFDLRTDGLQDTHPDELRVRFNEAWAGTFHGSQRWQTVGFMAVADAETTRLTFLEPGETTGDGSGPLIDNVRIFKVVVNDIVVDANGDEVGTDGQSNYVPGAGAQLVAESLNLTYPSGSNLTSVVIKLDGVVDGVNEIVGVHPSAIPTYSDGSPKVSVSRYDSITQELNLEGTATAEEYQRLVRSLVYYNAANQVNPASREIIITAVDSNLPADSSSASAKIQLDIETDQAVIDDTILQKFIKDNQLDVAVEERGFYLANREPGTGPFPDVNDTVRVRYHARFLELNAQNRLVETDPFDSSSDDGLVLALTNVIDGFRIGVMNLQTGGSGKLLIPSALAYGASGIGVVPPNAILIFDVELLEII